MKLHEGREYERTKQKQLTLFPETKRHRIVARLSEKGDQPHKKLLERMCSTHGMPLALRATRKEEEITPLGEYHKQQLAVMEAKRSELEAQRNELLKMIAELEFKASAIDRMLDNIKQVKKSARKLKAKTKKKAKKKTVKKKVARKKTKSKPAKKKARRKKTRKK